MDIFKPKLHPAQLLPIATAEVEAGFPSPAEDSQEMLDLQELLIPRPASTFFVRAKGDSMIGAGIFPKDLLIVDKSRTPQSGQIIIALYQGEFTLKRLVIEDKKIFLKPENPNYPLIAITQPDNFEVWGVVSHAIHSF